MARLGRSQPTSSGLYVRTRPPAVTPPVVPRHVETFTLASDFKPTDELLILRDSVVMRVKTDTVASNYPEAPATGAYVLGIVSGQLMRIPAALLRGARTLNVKSNIASSAKVLVMRVAMRLAAKANVGMSAKADLTVSGSAATVNNAHELYMWGGNYYNIISKETFGSATPQTTSSLSVWNDLRGCRGCLGGAANANILSISGTPYHYYDGTTNPSNPIWSVPTNGWNDTENAWLPTTGHFASWTALHTPAGGAGITKTFGWRAGIGIGMQNVVYGGQVVFWPWHNDHYWGTPVGSADAAVAAGEGSPEWAAAVASALSPVAGESGISFNGPRRSMLWDFMLLCRTGAAYGFTHSYWDPESAGDGNSGGMGTQGYAEKPAGQTEDQTRLYIKLRGQQMATIQVSEMGAGTDCNYYYQKLPGSIRELNYYRQLAGFEGFAHQASAYWLAGWASTPGVRKVFIRDATWYKGHRYVFPCSYDNGYRYDQEGSMAFMSTLFTDAERRAAMPKMAFGGALWPTNGVAGNEIGNGLPVQEFQDALVAAVKWNMGGSVAIFAAGFDDANAGTNTSTDHAPYEPAFQAALVPGVADAVAPAFTSAQITQGASSSSAGVNLVLSGTATDNMAMDRIDWINLENNATGSCRWDRTITFPGWNFMTTDMVNNDITSRADWQTANIPRVLGSNRIDLTAVDTHENFTTVRHTSVRTS